MNVVEKIEKRVNGLEEICRGSKLYWEQIIYEDEEYEITLLRHNDEAGFTIYITANDENAAVTLEELPEPVQEKILEELENCNLEEAIVDTVNED